MSSNDEFLARQARYAAAQHGAYDYRTKAADGGQATICASAASLAGQQLQTSSITSRRERNGILEMTQSGVDRPGYLLVDLVLNGKEIPQLTIKVRSSRSSTPVLNWSPR